jgi:hypothetical protein
VKEPIPDSRHLPVCFGLSYDRDAVVCRSCPALRACSTISLRWVARPSLAERLVLAERAASPDRIDVTRLERLYDELYRAHFARPSRRKRSTRNDVVFGRLLSFMLTNDIDPTTFIAANMEMLRDHCAGSVYGFQPNMLSGEKARARYNIYLRRANRRYRRGRADAFASSTELGRFRLDLMVSETEVASYYVHSGLSGSPVTWDAAIAASAPHASWLALYAGQSKFDRVFDLECERELAVLAAAVAVAESVANGLSRRVGFEDWSWEAFRALVCRLYPPVELSELDLRGVPGVVYGGGR